jgi:arsenate reductase
MGLNIAFICKGNSARSQMAEALCRHYAYILNKEISVYSAGSDPAKIIHPYSRKVMIEIGIDISSQRPKSINDIPLNQMDYIITLCSDAEKDCPVIGCKAVFHWNLPDPARYSGTEEQKIQFFREIRDKIEKKITDFLNSV